MAPKEKISAFVRSGSWLSGKSFNNSGAKYRQSPSLISSWFDLCAILDKPRSAILYFFVFEYKIFSIENLIRKIFFYQRKLPGFISRWTIFWLWRCRRPVQISLIIWRIIDSLNFTCCCLNTFKLLWQCSIY